MRSKEACPITAIKVPKGVNLIFHSIRAGGGMERYVRDLINGISALDIQLRVVCMQLDWPDKPPLGVEFVVKPGRTPLSRLNTLWFERSALRYCQPGWPVLSISRVPGCDIALAGGTHLGHLRQRGKRFLGLFNRLTVVHESRMYKLARLIVAHSSRVAEEIESIYGVPNAKIRTLYPPVDTNHFSLLAQNQREEVRLSLGIPRDAFLLLFPSNNHELKGADLILEALSDWNSGIRLAVVGKAPLIAPDVINLGYQKNMPRLYAAADAVILASRYEAFGLVGPESILCGTPVLFANQVGAGEVLSERACFRFERTLPSLRAALGEALKRHKSGTLQLNDPAAHIHYPFSVEQHLVSIFEALSEIQ